MGLTRDEKIALSQSVYAQSGAGAAEVQIGDDIPDNKVRYVWGMIPSSGAVSKQKLSIYHGDSVTPTRTTLAVLDLVHDTEDPKEYGGDPDAPLFVLRPDTTTTTTGNRIYLGHETSAVDVSMRYYDA